MQKKEDFSSLIELYLKIYIYSKGKTHTHNNNNKSSYLLCIEISNEIKKKFLKVKEEDEVYFLFYSVLTWAHRINKWKIYFTSEFIIYKFLFTKSKSVMSSSKVCEIFFINIP